MQQENLVLAVWIHTAGGQHGVTDKHMFINCVKRFTFALNHDRRWPGLMCRRIHLCLHCLRCQISRQLTCHRRPLLIAPTFSNEIINWLSRLHCSADECTGCCLSKAAGPVDCIGFARKLDCIGFASMLDSSCEFTMFEHMYVDHIRDALI